MADSFFDNLKKKYNIGQPTVTAQPASKPTPHELYKTSEGNVLNKQQYIQLLNKNPEQLFNAEPPKPVLTKKQAAGNLFNKVVDTAVGAGQGLLRGGAIIGATAMSAGPKGVPSKVKVGPLGKSLLGTEELETIPGLYREAKTVLPKESYGPVKSTTVAAAASLAPLLDLAGGGKKKITQKFADSALHFVSKSGKGDAYARVTADQLAKLKNEVKNIKFSSEAGNLHLTPVSKLEGKIPEVPLEQLRKVAPNVETTVKKMEQPARFIKDETGKFAGSKQMERMNQIIDEYPYTPSREILNSYKRANKKTPLKPMESFLESNPEAGFMRRPKLIDTKLGEALTPIKATDEVTQQIYNKWTRANQSAKELAQTESKTLADIPQKQSWQTVLDYEKGVPTPQSGRIAQTFDKLHTEAISRGLDVPYRQNYVPQMYKNAPEEVAEAVSRYMKDQGVAPEVIASYMAGKEIPQEITKALKLNPSFTKERVLPSYEIAMKYGLTPKYTHPAQLAAAYRESMETAIANRGLVNDLIKEGKLVGKKQMGYKVVDIPGLPKAMYAEPKLANALNGVFRDETNLSFGQSLLSMGAKASRFMQELALSAGFPGTDVNFFAIGQLIKELTSGKLKAIPAFIRANLDSQTIKFFKNKAPIIQKMADNGLDISNRTGNWRDAYKNMAAKPEWGKILGKGWDAAFQKKTFSSFMPQLYVNTFESTYKAALKKGLTEEAATKLAADTTRAFHGLFEDVARSKTTQDALSTAFFAPKFREGIIRTLWNTGKSLTTEIANPAFKQNRRLAVGMALTYGAYQYLNKQLNGNYTWDNETGREFSLKIPLPNDQVMYVEFMPSFLSLPRNLAGAAIAAKNLDPETFKQKVGSVFSMPIQTAMELFNNKDYFGRDIVGVNDSTEEKITKWAKYLGLQKTHPYLRLVADLTAPDEEFKKPLSQSLSEAAEFPLKFNSLDRISRQQFYKAVEEKAKESAKEQDRVRPIYEQAQKLLQEGKTGEADQLVNNLSDADYEIYKKIKSGDKTGATVRAKSKLYNEFLHIQDLKAQGNEAEAQRLVDAMSDDDYHAYTLLKKQFNP